MEPWLPAHSKGSEPVRSRITWCAVNDDSRLDPITALIRDAHDVHTYRSRYGWMGQLARAAIQRAMRAYTDRQRMIDERIVDALRNVDSRYATQGSLVHDLLAGSEAVSATTDLGPFWLDPEELLIRPYIELHGRWDPDLSALLRSELRPGMCVLDVGAHVGYITTLMARCVTETGRVVAVEADSYNAALLRANVFRNRVQNVVVMPVAAHRANGFLHLTSSHYGRSTTVARSADEWDPSASSTVQAVRLDDFMDDVLRGRSLDLVKIDTEGADHLVVEGLRSTLQAHPRCVVVVEVFPGQERLAEGATPAGVLKGYRKMGYDLELIGEHGSTRSVSVDDLLGIGRNDHDIVLNVILRRPESLSS